MFQMRAPWHKEDGCPLFQGEKCQEEVAQALSKANPIDRVGYNSKNRHPELHGKSYGAWMLVQRQTRKYTSKAKETMDTNQYSIKKKMDGDQSSVRYNGTGSYRKNNQVSNTGSRFESLNQEGAEARGEVEDGQVDAMNIEIY